MQAASTTILDAPAPIIGMIGMGVVGCAIATDLQSKGCRVICYDVNPSIFHNREWEYVTDLREMLSSTSPTAVQLVFLALPTPPSREGHTTHSITVTLNALATFSFAYPILIKSTVCPTTIESMQCQFPKLALFHCPEFLSARTSKLDAASPRQILIGVPASMPTSMTDRVVRFMHSMYPRVQTWTIGTKESEAVKMFCNTFYASKVLMFNEFYSICQDKNINFELVRQLMLQQGWIHPMHTQVPGSDGQCGLGGMCLPKDLLAFQRWTKMHGLSAPILHSMVSHCANNTSTVCESGETPDVVLTDEVDSTNSATSTTN
jgi:UDP-glucose 6-dehydrogenase